MSAPMIHVHPFINFLTNRVGLIHDSLVNGEYEQAVWRVRTLSNFLENKTRLRLDPLFNKIDSMKNNVSKIRGTDQFMTGWRKAKTRQMISYQLVEELVHELADALFEEGYLKNEKYRAIPTAGDKVSGVEEHPGLPPLMSSEVR